MKLLGRPARQPLSPREELAVRVFVGFGWLVVGIGSIFLGHATYPPGDIRGEPAYWVVFGLIGVGGGLAILASAVRKWRMLKRSG